MTARSVSHRWRRDEVGQRAEPRRVPAQVTRRSTLGIGRDRRREQLHVGARQHEVPLGAALIRTTLRRVGCARSRQEVLHLVRQRRPVPARLALVGMLAAAVDGELSGRGAEQGQRLTIPSASPRFIPKPSDCRFSLLLTFGVGSTGEQEDPESAVTSAQVGDA